MKMFVILAFVAAALISAEAAVSAPATAVSGRYAVTDLGELTCVPGESASILNCHTIGFVSQYSGSLDGTSVTNFEEIIDCEAGRTYGHGTETFTGSVAGRGSGTLVWRISFEASFDCSTFSLSNFSGRGVLFSGSGDLAHVRGNLDFTIDGYVGTLTHRA
jgi:Protein of unknown function (DUF3224)